MSPRRTPGLAVLVALVAALLPALALPAAAQDPGGGSVVISQVYGGGGNSGAFYRNDFVELFNQGDAAQDLTGWSVQYASQAGTGWNPTALTGSIAPGQRFLIQMASGANTSAEDLPTPDVVGTTAMAAGNAKVALVSSTTALPSNTCPTGDTVVDAVGYGSTGCAEIAITGTTNLSNNQSALRDEDRCGDTFSIISPPEPENTTAPLTPCTTGGGEDGEPIVPVCDDMTLARSEGGSVTLTASDADGTVTDAAITAGATDGISLTDPDPAGNVGGTFTVELAADDTLGARDYPVQVTFSNDDETPQTASCTATITVFLAVPDDVCEVDPAELTVINEIQGSGPSTPIEGEFVVTRGVVTTAFPSGGSTGLPNNHGLPGFFIEAVEADRDGDPQTSEGLFVFDFDGVYASEVGDLVYVAGTAGEGFDVTRISSNTFRSCDVDGLDTTLPAPTELPLPVAPSDRAEVLEPLESMRVTHPELTLVEFFELERFGQVRLSSAGVFQNPTNVVEPGSSAYTDLFDFNAANNILLSAGWTGQNINRPGPDGTPPLPYLEPGDTLRIGDQLIDQTFVLHYSFSNWRLQPVDIDELSDEFQANRTRPRPQTPPTAGGSLTVASFNVLNYFNGDGYFVEDDLATAQGFPNARGAVTPSEFRRQTEKIVDALIRMDADIVGLVEIENDAGDRQAAAALVEAVNDELRDEVYDYLDTGVIGTDAIKLAYIYKPSTVELSGDYAVLDSETDPRFDDGRSRPALAQTFTELATGESVTVTVNHLKSKGQSGL
ncbi:MAG: ExeM/NucH family extracellular endonuclease, partial [Nitriliruptor sp.]